jgi:hypothetical protein
VITRDPPPPPPFPPDEFSTLVTTASGLVLRATGEVVSTNPTTIRITTTVTNPTSEEIVAQILLGDCETIIAGFWQQNSAGRLLQPLDGFIVTEASPTPVDCELVKGLRPIAPGAVVDMTKEEDLVVSEVLGAAFVAGRHIFTVVYVDTFVYQVLALDVFIEN